VSEPVRIGMAGAGRWGRHLLRNFATLPGSDLRWICDPDDGVLHERAAAVPTARPTTDFDDLLSDTELEAVVLATPVPTHHELARRALEAGKHVFVEKPLAASVADATAIVSLGRKRERIVMTGHTFLYSPAVNLIREQIHQERIGVPYFISMSRVNLGLHQNDVSVVWDLGPHDFSILRYWLGETPARLAALSRDCIVPGTPDVAFINLEFASGTIAHVEIAWLAPSKLRRTAIVGSRKMVVYDDTSNEPVRVFDSGVLPRDPTSFGEYKLTYRTGDIVSPRIEAAEPLLLELNDFCDAIRSGAAPRSSSSIGVEVVRMIEAVDRSLAESGARVEIGAASEATL